MKNQRIKTTNKISDTALHTYKKAVWEFYNSQGRHTLPWRKKTTTPYHILVSEIMLQQTQVQRVIPKYKAFITSFPTAKSLAAATTKDVLAHWVGLGYNRRALNLQKSAQEIVTVHHNRFPKTYETLLTLPGVGPYTAGAVAAFAFNKPVPILETNIRTALIYHFFLSKQNVSEQALLELSQLTLDIENPKEWYWALMDYGSHLKQIHGNLSRKSKSYTKQSQFKGSIRELRGLIIKRLSQKDVKHISCEELMETSKRSKTDVQQALGDLVSEKIIKKRKDSYILI